jgi:general stress protein 26
MNNEKQDAIGKLRDLIHDIDFCMLTTVDGGHLRSRPMSTQKFEFDGDLWFFTSDTTHKMEEIEHDNRVNVSYAKPDDNKYISVSGRAEMVRDRGKIEELWSPILKAWFPDGLEDPHLCLLKVEVERAEYWDSPSGTLIQIYGFLKAIATGTSIDPGENKKLEL